MSESEQTEEGGNIFPLIDRRTPVLDRIRNRSNDDSLAGKVGEEVAASIIEDERFTPEEEMAIKDKFKEGVARGLGVENPDHINDDVARDFQQLFTSLTEEDILTSSALEQLGLKSKEEEDEEEEESSAFDTDDEEDEEDVNTSDFT